MDYVPVQYSRELKQMAWTSPILLCLGFILCITTSFFIWGYVTILFSLMLYVTVIFDAYRIREMAEYKHNDKLGRALVDPITTHEYLDYVEKRLLYLLNNRPTKYTVQYFEMAYLCEEFNKVYDAE